MVGLGFIKKLYEVDQIVMKQPPSDRTAQRRIRAGPVLDAFKRWLDAEQQCFPECYRRVLDRAREQWRLVVDRTRA